MEDNYQNLSNQDAKDKIKDLIDDINTCMFVTHSKSHELSVRPMSTSQVDDDGKIWFMSHKNSKKNQEIKETNSVNLLYAKNSDNHFLSIKGSATILQDKSKIEELRSPFVKARFSDGKEDPNLTLICVIPSEGYYRDTKYGKMVSLIKIAVAAVTGEQMDGSLEGKLNL